MAYSEAIGAQKKAIKLEKAMSLLESVIEQCSCQCTVETFDEDDDGAPVGEPTDVVIAPIKKQKWEARRRLIEATKANGNDAALSALKFA